MVATNKYYYKFGEVEEDDIDGVIDDSCNVGIDQIDTCTVNMMVDDRTAWKKVLKNKLFKKIRRSDSHVEFRGWITEVRYSENDRYNLVLKVKSKIMVLNDLTSHVTSEWLIDPDTGEGSEGTITARDATTITNSEDIEEPPAYVSESTAVMIVPGTDPTFVRDDVEDSLVPSTGAVTESGTFADLNDDDYSTGVRVYKLITQELFLEIKGSSTNAKASVVGAKVEFSANVRVRGTRDITLKLEYWDGDSWEQIGSSRVVEKQAHAALFLVWDTNITIGPGEYISGNDFLDGSDDFRFRLIASTVANVKIEFKATTVKVEIFTDAKYNGAYFPITAYTSAKVLTVNVNPVTAGIDVSDTLVIGWKDTITLAEIFDEYYTKDGRAAARKDIPFATNIDSNFAGYTARSFYDMSLMDCVQYFLEKQQAHYYYDHHADTLYLRKESTMITDGTLRTITEANVENYGLDDKEDTNVKEVIVVGASYKRGDGDEILVDYSYPYDDFLGAGLGYTGIARKVLKIPKPEIKSWTEARLYSKAMFELMNTPELSLNIKLAAYQDAYVVGNKLTVTGGLDSITVSAEPIIAINTTYDVGNDLAIKRIQVGWQRTPLLKRHSDLMNKLARSVRDLQKYSRQTASQKGHKLLRADGIIDGAGITFTDVIIDSLEIVNAAGANPTFTASGAIPMVNLDVDFEILAGKVIRTPKIDATTLEIVNPDGVNPTMVASGVTPKVTCDVDFDLGNKNLTATGTAALGIISSGQYQGTAIVDTYLAALTATKLTGLIDDDRVKLSNVSQHQASLAVKGSLLSDNVPDARLTSLTATKLSGLIDDDRVKETNVTQHQAAITALGTITSPITINTGAATAFSIQYGGGTPSLIQKTSGSDEIVYSGDLKVEAGKFSASSVYIGDQLLSEFTGSLRLNTLAPGIILKDTNNTGASVSGFIASADMNNLAHWWIGESAANSNLYVKNSIADAHIYLDPSGTGGIVLNAGAAINDIDTVMAASPLDTQLLTAQAIKEWVSTNNVSSPFTVEYQWMEGVLHMGTQSDTQYSSGIGTYNTGTGHTYLYMFFVPPDWLVRYCEDQGKTLTLTQIILRWNNTVSADYLTEVDYYWVDGNTAATTTLYTNLTNLGQGTVAFRNDTATGTNQVFTRGDIFYARADPQQGTANSCRMFGLQATYTIT